VTNDGLPFHDYFRARIEGDLPGTDDVLGVLLPLLEQVREAHERGQVAPLAGLAHIQVSNDRCWFL
jgi:hypothetical protein